MADLGYKWNDIHQMGMTAYVYISHNEMTGWEKSLLFGHYMGMEWNDGMEMAKDEYSFMMVWIITNRGGSSTAGEWKNQFH